MLIQLVILRAHFVSLSERSTEKRKDSFFLYFPCTLHVFVRQKASQIGEVTEQLIIDDRKTRPIAHAYNCALHQHTLWSQRKSQSSPGCSRAESEAGTCTSPWQTQCTPRPLLQGKALHLTCRQPAALNSQSSHVGIRWRPPCGPLSWTVRGWQGFVVPSRCMVWVWMWRRMWVQGDIPTLTLWSQVVTIKK